MPVDSSGFDLSQPTPPETFMPTMADPDQRLELWHWRQKTITPEQDLGPNLPQIKTTNLGKIQEFRAAGFNDDEIAGWAQTERARLQGAGFTDQEISQQMLGFPEPDKIPIPLIQRVSDGDGGKYLPSYYDKSVQPIALGDNFGKTLKAFAKGAVDNFGGELIGNEMASMFGINLDQTGGPLRSWTNALNRGIFGPLDIINRGIRAIIGGGGQATAETMAQAGFIPEARKERVGNDLSDFLNIAGVLAGAEPIYKPMVGADGTPKEIPLGPVPKGTDFLDAAHAIAGTETPPAVNGKLLTLYENQGIHPAEVAQDAMTNPGVAEDLLSIDDRLPYQKSVVKPRDELKFTPDERTALSILTGNPRSINDQIAGIKNHFSPEGFTKHTAALDSAINKSVLTDDITVYRGASAGRFEDNKIIDLPVGSTFTNPAYPFTSTSQEIGKSFASVGNGTLYTIKVPKGSPALYLNSDNLTIWPGQDEVILPRNTTFRKVSQSGNNIELEVVPNAEAAKDTVVSPGESAISSTPSAEPEILPPGSKTPVDDVKGGTSEEPPVPATAEGTGGKPPEPPEEPPLPPSNFFNEPEKFTTVEGVTEADRKNAETKILDQMSIGEQEPKRPLTMGRIYQEMMDSFFPVAEAIKDATGEPAKSQDFNKGITGYESLRLLSGVGGKISHILQHGPIDFDTYQPVLDRYDRTIPGLGEIIAPLQKDLNRFRATWVAARDLELARKGINTGFDRQAAINVLRGARAEDIKAMGQLVDYQNAMISYIRKSGLISAADEARIVSASEFFAPFHRVMGIEERFGYGKNRAPKEVLKRIEGGDQRVIDPLETVVKNTFAFTRMADINEAKLQFIDAVLDAQKTAPTGAGKELVVKDSSVLPKLTPEETATNNQTALAIRDMLKKETGTDPSDSFVQMLTDHAYPPRESEITLWRDGVRETYSVDPDIARAFASLDRESVGMLMRGLGLMTRVKRTGVLISPTFWARHLMREPWYLAATYENQALTPVHALYDMGRGIVYQVLQNFGIHEDVLRDFEVSGGSHNSMVSLDRNFLQENLAQLNLQTGFLNKFRNSTANPVVAARMILDSILGASHYGAFIRAREQMLKNGTSLDGQPLTKQQLRRLGYISRDVSVDGARVGTFGKSYNMVTMFANNTLQDTDRLFRAAKDNPIKFALVAGSMILGSAMIWAWNHNQPEYKYARKNSKNMNWILPVGNGLAFQMPKPFALGAFFGTLTENILDALNEKDPAQLKNFLEAIYENTVPNMAPDAVVPFMEQWANKHMYDGTPLVPDSLQKYLPQYQYKPFTTGIAKQLAQLISSLPYVNETSLGQTLSNPTLIENYVNGWSGTLGTQILQLMDKGAQTAGVVPKGPVLPAERVEVLNIPFVRAFIKSMPQLASAPIDEFYQNYDHSAQTIATFKELIKRGDAQAAMALQQIGGPASLISLEKQHTAMGKMFTAIRNSYYMKFDEDPVKDAEQKRQIIDSLYYQLINTALVANQNLKQIQQNSLGLIK